MTKEAKSDASRDEIEINLKDPVLAGFWAWLWPGAGHLYQGRYAKGALFMICILGTFFSGLFILVGALEEQGVIEWIATNLFLSLGDNPYLMVLTVLWVSGIASGFLDNIPFTITMVPVVQMMLSESPIPNNILWWALALGACF